MRQAHFKQISFNVEICGGFVLFIDFYKFNMRCHCFEGQAAISLFACIFLDGDFFDCEGWFSVANLFSLFGGFFVSLTLCIYITIMMVLKLIPK